MIYSSHLFNLTLCLSRNTRYLFCYYLLSHHHHRHHQYDYFQLHRHRYQQNLLFPLFKNSLSLSTIKTEGLFLMWCSAWEACPLVLLRAHSFPFITVSITTVVERITEHQEFAKIIPMSWGNILFGSGRQLTSFAVRTWRHPPFD